MEEENNKLKTANNDFVKLIWYDSHALETGWHFLDEYSKQEPCIVTSYGKIIYEDDIVIALAHNYAAPFSENKIAQVNGTMVIPKLCIIEKVTF